MTEVTQEIRVRGKELFIEDRSPWKKTKKKNNKETRSKEGRLLYRKWKLTLKSVNRKKGKLNIGNSSTLYERRDEKRDHSKRKLNIQGIRLKKLKKLWKKKLVIQERRLNWEMISGCGFPNTLKIKTSLMILFVCLFVSSLLF